VHHPKIFPGQNIEEEGRNQDEEPPFRGLQSGKLIGVPDDELQDSVGKKYPCPGRQRIIERDLEWRQTVSGRIRAPPADPVHAGSSSGRM
jgi:hypothetical protein